jgi:hypothetical protein
MSERVLFKDGLGQYKIGHAIDVGVGRKVCAHIPTSRKEREKWGTQDPTPFKSAFLRAEP